jgi:5-carboxymethyl-2-hydroxymuconate isomerase
MPIAHLQESKRVFTVPKILCIGRNYAEHAKEMKAAIPTAPVFFLKPPSAIIHSGESIIIPSISTDVHHEVEMTVLIGSGGKNISRDKALDYVAGYGIGLDMTLRDIQAEAKKQGLPWTLAKGFDTSAPISDFVPARSITNPNDVRVELKVNGSARQSSSTSNFLFRVEDVIVYLSQFITLEEGDIVFTGTPEGVAQVFSGDKLEARLLSNDGSTLASIAVGVR